MRCPNCSYKLVLLEKRRKYKCAKCGRLFPKKETEDREFREWNKRRKKQLKIKLFGKPQRQSKLSEYEKKRRAKASFKKWYDENKENENGYYQKNRQKLNQKKREYRKGLSGQQKKEQNEKRNALRRRNKEGTRLNSRIWYWRQQQKALALAYCEFEYIKACNIQFQEVLPTKLHSELLSL